MAALKLLFLELELWRDDRPLPPFPRAKRPPYSHIW
jgi:hypothetical protein